MFERFTDRARRVVVLAQEYARDLGQFEIGTSALVLGVFGAGGVGADALLACGITDTAIRALVVAPDVSGDTGHIPFSKGAKTALDLSLREALQLGHNYIGCEHLLLGIIRSGDFDATFVRLGTHPSKVRQEIIRLLVADIEVRRQIIPPPEPAEPIEAKATIVPVLGYWERLAAEGQTLVDAGKTTVVPLARYVALLRRQARTSRGVNETHRGLTRWKKRALRLQEERDSFRQQLNELKAAVTEMVRDPETS